MFESKQEIDITVPLWKPFCDSTPFAREKWPFKRGRLSSGVEINSFFDLHSQVASPEGVASDQGVLSKGVPLNIELICENFRSK